ncbi:hypothetical protein PGB90_006844 [Kerria lacca]
MRAGEDHWARSEIGFPLGDSGVPYEEGSHESLEKSESCRIFGIEFVPLRIPWKQRLQTIAVAFLLFLTIGVMVISIPLILYVLIFTKYWYIWMVYVVWIIYDRKTPYRGGRKLTILRNSKIFKYASDYFPTKLIKTADLPADKNYMFCVYPHGNLCTGAFLNFQSNANKFDDLFPGIDPYIVTLNTNFRIPFTRDIFLAFGAISASEDSLLYCLQKKAGNSCVIMPGGVREALRAVPGTCNIILQKRRGFVRVALKTGASLVPVFSFGENYVYNPINGRVLLWIQKKLRKILGYTLCLFNGRGFFQYSFGLLPHQRPIVTVVGKPISVPENVTPTMELIAEYHKKYVDALVSLFNEYKGMYHPKGNDGELQIE